MVDFTRADVVEPALAVIQSADALDRVLFSGGNVDGHRLVRSLAPAARIALTWTDAEPPPESLLEQLGVEYFNPPWELVDEQVVESMHDRGRKVSTWTVDESSDMRRVADLGVDAIVTNRVAELVALLAEAIADRGGARRLRRADARRRGARDGADRRRASSRGSGDHEEDGRRLGYRDGPRGRAPRARGDRRAFPRPPRRRRGVRRDGGRRRAGHLADRSRVGTTNYVHGLPLSSFSSASSTTTAPRPGSSRTRTGVRSSRPCEGAARCGTAGPRESRTCAR